MKATFARAMAAKGHKTAIEHCDGPNQRSSNQLMHVNTPAEKQVSSNHGVRFGPASLKSCRNGGMIQMTTFSKLLRVGAAAIVAAGVLAAGAAN
ncbi:MAG: hypothetical protein Q8R92_13485, partial [Deltaproteobacteria bacterium]|nr:hypothetical protein [Deltaproteobacteria bacterium]